MDGSKQTKAGQIARPLFFRHLQASLLVYRERIDQSQ